MIYKYNDFEEDEKKQRMYRPWNPRRTCFSCVDIVKDTIFKYCILYIISSQGGPVKSNLRAHTCILLLAR